MCEVLPVSVASCLCVSPLAAGASLRQVVHTFVGHTDACVAADFTVGGSKLVSGSWDGTVRIWETTSGDNSQTLIGHKGKVTSVAFSDTGEWLVSGGYVVSLIAYLCVHYATTTTAVSHNHVATVGAPLYHCIRPRSLCTL